VILYLILALAAALLIGLAALLWRVWDSYTNRTPEDEVHEHELASLNDAQANRVSDQQLTRPIDNDSAWQTMVQRGGPPPRRRRRR
jgi:Flp pilus assembly protein TadB